MMDTSNQSKFSRGSEWRKWDLHIHTPESFHWGEGLRFSSMNDDEIDTSIKRIIEKFNDSESAVFAIVDYWTVDGYLRIKKYLERNPDELSGDKLILPGIELRITAPVDYRLNMQVIFDDQLSDQKLMNFVRGLKLTSTNESLSEEALRDFALSLTSDKARHHGHPEYKNNEEDALLLGSKAAEISIESFKNAINSLPSRDNCFVVMPWDTSDGLSGLDWKNHSGSANEFMLLPDIFESRSPEMKLTFNGFRTEQNETFFDDFFNSLGGQAKPVICGSDAHKVSEYGKFPSNKCTWIKADPSFEGLRQIKYEPLDRVFIGDVPEPVRRVSSDQTRYIDRLNFIQKPNVSPKIGSWFGNQNILLNSELVAVIGNKGSGKSAIADIVGFLGNSKKGLARQEYSFLTKKRFKQRGLADCFDAQLLWKDGTKSEACLIDDSDPIAPERVQYIPQNFFEALTNELQLKNFETELKRVVFSHLPDALKSGHDSFDALEAERAQVIEREIDTVKSDVKKLSKDLMYFENLKRPEELQATINELKIKELELVAHDKNKPIEPERSEDESSQADKNITAINDINKDIVVLEQSIQDNQSRLSVLTRDREELRRALTELTNLQELVGSYQLKYSDIFSKHGVPKDAIKLICAPDQVNTAIEKLNQKIDEIDLALKTEEDIDSDIAFEVDSNEIKSKLEEGSLFIKLVKLKLTRDTLKEKISQPARDRQNYTEALQKWQLVKNQILGDSENPNNITNSIAYLKNKERFISDSLDVKRAEIRQALLDKTKEVFSKKSRILSLYNEFKETVENKVKRLSGSDESLTINIETAFKVNKDISSQLLKLIDTRKKGTFINNDVNNLLVDIFSDDHFQEPEEMESTIQKLFSYLDEDWRDESNKVERYLLHQIPDLEEFLNIVFGLDYLNPVYKLKLDDKDLEELSPGEKGALLLVFYLTVDQDSVPLIIDQPEDNLDNQTVYRLLTHYIKEAKKSRQIIIVTHNPNLAIGADAEQIIHVQLDKSNDHKFKYTAGSIENPLINAKVVEVLEGTKPAFDQRRLKYQN